MIGKKSSQTKKKSSRKNGGADEARGNLEKQENLGSQESPDKTFMIQDIFKSILSTSYRAMFLIKSSDFKMAYEYTTEIIKLYLSEYSQRFENAMAQVLACAKEWKGQIRNSLIKSLLSMPVKLENLKFSSLFEEKLDFYSIQIFDFLSEDKEEFDADAIAIASNFFIAGGIMIILVPDPITQPFLSYFADSIEKYVNCFTIDHDMIERNDFTARGIGLMLDEVAEQISSILVNSFEPKKINPQVRPYLSRRKYSGLSRANIPQFTEIVKVQGSTMTEDEYIDTLAFTEEQTEFLDIIFTFMSPYKLPDKKLGELVADKKIVFLYGAYGTGKSTAVALYLFRLCLEKDNNTLKEVVITSTKIGYIQGIFRKLSGYLTEKEIKFKARKDSAGNISLINSPTLKIRYVKCDNLISQKEDKADMIIIDEAGYLPIKDIETMIMSSNRIMILNTNNGYRRTGNVLQHKLYNRIYSLAEKNSWLVKELLFSLGSSIHQSDPLELFFNRVFFLENVCPITESDELDEDNFILVPLDKKTINSDSKPFFELFGILNNSFYINSVKLFQRSIEDDRIKLFGLYESAEKKTLLANVITEYQGGAIEEGYEYNSIEIDQVINDIPEILNTHYMDKRFLDMKSVKILRLAKNPMVNNDFIGSKVISYLIQYFEEEKIDYISTIYNMSPGLIRFWIRNDFIPIHVSLEKDGLWDYPVIQVHHLNDNIQEIFALNNIRFRKKILFWLRDELKSLNPLSAFLLFTVPISFTNIKRESGITEYTLRRLGNYFNNRIEYRYISDAINEIIEESLVYQNIPEVDLSTQQKMLIIMKIQSRSDSDISDVLGINTKQMFKQYHSAIKAIYDEIILRKKIK